MPPKYKFTKEEIVQAALDLTRTEGFSALTARGVAAKLSSSPKVIFGTFRSMEQLQNAMLASAHALYRSYLEEDIASGKYPPYKASGMGYIRFAMEEPELFRLLFMRNRSGEEANVQPDESDLVIPLIQQATGLSRDRAEQFHLSMWIYVHGIATMAATSFLDWDLDFASRLITDAYQSMKAYYMTCEEG